MSKEIVLKSFLAIVSVGFVLSFSSCKKDPKPTDTSVSPPVNLSVTDITGTSVKLLWTGTADSYEILLTHQSATDIPLTSTTNTCLVTDLTENTMYTWKIRAKKGNNYSEWINGPSFTTIENTFDIVGKWQYEKVEITELECTVPAMESMIRAGLPGMFPSMFTAFSQPEFTTDGKFCVPAGNEVGSYTTEGNRLTITLPNGTKTCGYSISGNKMYWDLDVFEFAGEELEAYADLLSSVTKLGVRVTFARQ